MTQRFEKIASAFLDMDLPDRKLARQVIDYWEKEMGLGVSK